MPMLAERGDDALLDGPAARAADRNAHLVVATKTEQIVLKAIPLYIIQQSQNI